LIAYDSIRPTSALYFSYVQFIIKRILQETETGSL